MTSCKQGIVSFLIVVLLTQLSLGQETEQDFASLKKQWTEMEAQLKEKEEAANSGDAAAKTEYRDLLDQANALIDQLKSSGIEALKTDPKSRDTIRTLMGIMVNDAQAFWRRFHLHRPFLATLCLGLCFGCHFTGQHKA